MLYDDNVFSFTADVNFCFKIRVFPKRKLVQTLTQITYRFTFIEVEEKFRNLNNDE